MNIESQEKAVGSQDALHKKLDQNHQLWKLEDQIVAKALHVTYFWYENGAPTEQRKRTIVIDLPNSLAALFRV